MVEHIERTTNKLHTPVKIVSTFDAELLKTDEYIGTDLKYKHKVLWFPFAVTMIAGHICGIYGFYLWLFKCLWTTTIYAALLEELSMVGITAGVHRLFSHKSYKANTATRLLLVILFIMAGQLNVYKWVLNHRQHHKYTDTDADPHNSRQGLFFSYLGWLIMSPHPAMVEKRKGIDMTDLDKDPIVIFQRRNYFMLFFIISVLFPVGTTMYFFNETLWNAFFVSFWFRWMVSLHFTWCVNSVTHWRGDKPYDKRINATQSRIISLLTCGEGYHNYHHAFPWDYRTAESDVKRIFNRSTFVIDMLARLGWTYDLRTTSEDMMIKTIYKTGDGSHRFANGLK